MARSAAATTKEAGNQINCNSREGKREQGRRRREGREGGEREGERQQNNTNSAKKQTVAAGRDCAG